MPGMRGNDQYQNDNDDEQDQGRDDDDRTHAQIGALQISWERLYWLWRLICESLMLITLLIRGRRRRGIGLP